MELSKLGTGLTLLALCAWFGLAVTSLGIENDLFLSSEYQSAALVTLLFVLVVLAGYAAIGTPWKRWQRTPYW